MEKQSGQGKKQTVLFLCTGNSCRSQMAEAFLRDQIERRIRGWLDSGGPVAASEA